MNKKQYSRLFLNGHLELAPAFLTPFILLCIRRTSLHHCSVLKIYYLKLQTHDSVKIVGTLHSLLALPILVHKIW